MFCNQCGHACTPSDTFCAGCGTAVHQPPGRARTRVLVVVLSLVALLAAGGIAVAVAMMNRAAPAGDAAASGVASVDAAPLDQQPTFDVARLSPSVLTLRVFDANGQQTAQGSGFVFRDDGLAVTNWHVAKSAHAISATDGSGRTFTVTQLINADQANDLATLQLRLDAGTTVTALQPADTRTVKPGSHVYTISTPIGLSQTISDGMLSGIRQLAGQQVFQITAPISPGSSGGPVFNDRGEVIGVIMSQYQVGQQLNFAIPIDTVVRLMASPSELVQSAPADRQPDAPLFDRALAAFNEARYADAARLFEEVIAANPTQAAAFYNAGLAYQNLKNYGRASDYYRDFIQRADPQSDDVQRARNFLAAYATTLSQEAQAVPAGRGNAQ
jgi:S1-C subfamily serine protease